MENVTPENCGPECNCNKPSPNKKAKTVVCIIVVIAIGCIFAYKAKSAKQALTESTAAFVTTPGCCPVNETDAAVVISESADKTVENKTIQEPVVETAANQNRIGESLDSLASLNKVAINQDAVFVFVSSKDDIVISKETIDAITSAERKIKSAGTSLGLYTLQTSSPEYTNITAQLSAPSMLVLSKGRGMGAVTGGITEEKILQAYVASSQAGCGPSGCGPSGCAPTAPALGPRRN